MNSANGPHDGPATAARLPTVFRRAGDDLWRSLADLVIYDLVFKAIALVVLSPLVAWLFERFVAASGDRAVGNLDMARFLLTPFGVGMSIVIASLAFAVFLANCAGLVTIGFAAAGNRRVTYLEALVFVARRFGRILWASFLSLVVVAIAALPFVVAALVVGMSLLAEHDINYYLDVRPPEFWRAIRIGAVIGVLAAAALVVVSVPLVFVLPGALTTDEPLRRVFIHSFRLARGNFGRILLTIVTWLIVWNTASLAMNGTIYGLGRALVSAAGQRLAALLVTLGSVTALSILANFALSFAAVATGCLVLVRLYLDATGRQKLPVAPFGEHAGALGAKAEWSVPRKGPLALALVALVLAGFVVRHVLEDVRWEDHVDITAHRGASLAAPENSASAVKRAITDGATFVEVDVQRTADGVLVVAHDADLMRVARRPLVIAESSYEELREVDIGRFFAEEFAGERIAMLDEVIDLTKGKVKLIVELKSYGADAGPLIAGVVRTLRTRDMLTEAVVMSLAYKEMQEVKRLEPRLKVGFVASATLGDLSRLDVDFLAVSKSQATDALVASAHAQGKQVFVWTVDDRPDMFTMLDRGVDNIITNDPALLSAILKERESLDNAQRILLRFKSLYVK